MNPVATMAQGAWLAASLPAWMRFRHALDRPEETQRQVLRNVLRRHADSAYGRAHGFERMESYEQFREQVPLTDYEQLEPWVARIMRGEKSVLSSDPVTRLLPTSGSTGGRKLIPFTASLQRELNRAIGPWMVDLCRQHPALPYGPAYWSISPAIHIADVESAIPVNFDDDSAYLGGFRQWLAAATFAVPSALRLVEDIETCRYLTLLCLLRARDLRLISVWHPSFLTILLETLETCWTELLGDVAKGGCGRAGILRPEVRRAISTTAMPQRAEELRVCGPVRIGMIWPNLRVVSCWGDAQAALPLEALRPRLPGVIFQPKGLLATEAFVSIPFQGHHPVAIRSHFFEFLDARGDAHLAHELRAGESYEVVVSTGGGLWRYRLGDIVEVDGFVAATPSLRFLGRGKSVSDLCGEKLAEPFVARALATACASFSLVPAFAMLAPDGMAEEPQRYALFIEGDVPRDLPNRLDEELRKNPHYALCRDLRQLAPLTCCRIDGGAYETFCQVQVAVGLRLGDIKPQALSTRTDWRTQFAGRK